MIATFQQPLLDLPLTYPRVVDVLNKVEKSMLDLGTFVEQHDIKLPAMKHHTVRTYNGRFTSGIPPRSPTGVGLLRDHGLLINRNVAFDAEGALIRPSAPRISKLRRQQRPNGAS